MCHGCVYLQDIASVDALTSNTVEVRSVEVAIVTLYMEQEMASALGNKSVSPCI